MPSPVIFLLVLLVVAGLPFRWTRWGRYLFAIGGNEHAATLTGVPVKPVKVSVYMFCALCAGIAGILEVGWLGTITTGLGQGMELTVIAASVIGGTNLSGGIGTAFGAVVGAALIEVIRNSLILLGISTFWQGTFVGSFIVIAVLFDRLRTGAPTDVPSRSDRAGVRGTPAPAAARPSGGTLDGPGDNDRERRAPRSGGLASCPTRGE